MYDVKTYSDIRGHSPLDEFLLDLNRKARTNKQDRVLLEKIMFCVARLRVDGTTKERSGYISPLRDGIYELRPKDHRILFFHWKDGCYVLCHVFRKQSQKTPRREIEKAVYAREDWIRRCGL